MYIVAILYIDKKTVLIYPCRIKVLIFSVVDHFSHTLSPKPILDSLHATVGIRSSQNTNTEGEKLIPLQQ